MDDFNPNVEALKRIKDKVSKFSGEQLRSKKTPLVNITVSEGDESAAEMSTEDEDALLAGYQDEQDEAGI